MAKQDFAQVKANTKPESESGSGSVLSAIGILVIAGLCFSGGYWLGAGDIRQTGNTTDVDAVEAKLAAQVATNKLLQAKNETLADMVQQWKSKAKEGAHTKVGELSFYKDLPKQSVTPAPVPDAPAPEVKLKPATKPVQTQQIAVAETMVEDKPAPVADSAPAGAAGSGDHYRIQLASFRSEADAITMQNKLGKAGFSAQVEFVDLNEKGRWYRLFAGPFASRAHAETARLDIESRMKLKGFLKRVR